MSFYPLILLSSKFLYRECKRNHPLFVYTDFTYLYVQTSFQHHVFSFVFFLESTTIFISSCFHINNLVFYTEQKLINS